MLYLTAAGIGNLHIVDVDKVELSNLHRQVLHDEAGALNGENKALSAVRRLTQLNSSITIVAHDVRLNSDNAIDLLTPHDIVVDATDNLETRYLLSDACVLLGKPLVAGSAVALEGQVTVLCTHGGPCYRCLHPLNNNDRQSERSCTDAGVLGPVPGLIGCLQAAEVIKLLCPTMNRQYHSPPVPFEPLIGRQNYYDGLRGDFHTFDVSSRDPNCAACGLQSFIKTMKESSDNIQMALGTSSSCARGSEQLPATQRVTAVSFVEQLTKLVNGRSPNPSGALCVLDVRAETQYEMVSLLAYYSSKSPNNSNKSVEQRYNKLIINSAVLHRHIPLARLKVMSPKEVSHVLFGSDETPLLPVYVLCRRGIDSATATAFLNSIGFEAFNIEGGINAWNNFIDNTFPLY